MPSVTLSLPDPRLRAGRRPVAAIEHEEYRATDGGGEKCSILIKLLCMAGRAINKLGPTYHWYISPLKLSTTKTEVKSFFIPNLLVPPSLFSILAIRIIVCECTFQSPCSSTKSNIYFLMFLCFCACRPFHLLCSSLMSPLKQHLL